MIHLYSRGSVAIVPNLTYGIDLDVGVSQFGPVRIVAALVGVRSLVAWPRMTLAATVNRDRVAAGIGTDAFQAARHDYGALSSLISMDP